MKPYTAPCSLEHRIANAKDIMRNACSDEHRSVIFSSFGKESLVLIQLADELGLNTDVGYFELGFASEKHAFARYRVNSLGDRVFRLVPFRTVTIAGADNTSLGYQFRLTTGDVITIAGATFDESNRQEVECAIERGLIRYEFTAPTYNWNSIVCGRRSSERDVTVGDLFWPSTLYRMEFGAKISMPLLNWSDSDVMNFLQSRAIQIDWRRYQKHGRHIVERPDKTYSPDHVNCCCRCASVGRGAAVLCPVSRVNIVSLLNVQPLEYRSDVLVKPIVML